MAYANSMVEVALPFNGSGTFTRVHSWTDDRNNGIKIVADRHDEEDDGFATGLSNTIAKDGQSTTTARIPFANGIGLNDGTVSAPAISFNTDSNTGIYRIGADNIGIAIGGAKKIDIAADGVTFADPLTFGGVNLNRDSSITWAAWDAGRGPFSIAVDDNSLGTGLDPHWYAGYNQLPRAILVNTAEPGLIYGIEADYDDGSDENKFEAYLQHKKANSPDGFDDGSTTSYVVRPFFIQTNKVTDLPTIFNFASAGLGFKWGWVDGTGTIEEQTVGKNKALLTNKLFQVYNVPGGTNTIFELNSTVTTPESGLTVTSAARTGGIHLGARSPGTDEPVYIDGKGTLGAIILNDVYGAPVYGPDSGFNFELDQDTGMRRDGANRIVFFAQGIPALTIDASTASSATGLFSGSRAAGGGHHVTVSSSGTNETLYLDGKGTGQVVLNNDNGGQVIVPNGAVGTPGIAFNSDQDCGFYRIGANNFGASANGSKVLDISTTGLGITGVAAATGNVSSTGGKTFGALGVGVPTGSGGAVTQATSKTTSVTLNKASGEITLNNSTVTGGAAVGFTFNNSAIEATDVLAFNVIGGTNGGYYVGAACVAGAASVFVRNLTGSNLSEAITLRYVLLKGANA